MTGHMVALGPCWVHKGVFEFDPDTVPSVLVDPQVGMPPDVAAETVAGYDEKAGYRRARREPVCPGCCEQINAERARRGIPGRLEEGPQ